MEEGTVAFWSVRIGDQVSVGDVLAEIESEKLTNELRTEESGVVLDVLVNIGESVPCGTPILIIGQKDEAYTSIKGDKINKNALSKLVETEVVETKFLGENLIQQANSRITPRALQLAKELNVDFSSIVGSGRHQLITREDIRKSFENKNPPLVSPVPNADSPATSVKKISRMQLSIINTMEKSTRETIQTTISLDMDADNLVNFHHQLKSIARSEIQQPSITAIFINIVAKALVDHPLLRTIIMGDNLITKNEINIGVVVDVNDGLVIPNIKNADRKNIFEINKELRQLVQKAQQNRLNSSEISGGSFTISNLGMYGIKYFNPIINPGESGILGIGALQKVTQIKENGIFITPIIPLNLTYNHSVLNGVSAAKFLNTIQAISTKLISTN